MRSRATPSAAGTETGAPKRKAAGLRRLGRRLAFPIIGCLSLLWFLARVIPRPSRAAYPCQRAAFPLASAFILWLTGIGTSSVIGRRAVARWRQERRGLALSLGALAGLLLVVSASIDSSPVGATLSRLRSRILATTDPLVVRSRSGDSLTVTPRAVVGVVKSVEAQAVDITATEITALVNLAIARAGGLEDLVSDGDTVVLKPNLIASRDLTYAGEPLTPEVNGIATDHRVIQATVDAVRALNPSGAIFLLEGSGVGMTAENMAVVGWDAITGLDSLVILEEACGDWWDTTSVYLRGVSLPEDKYLYSQGDNRYWLNDLYYEADVLISLPVLKNHFCTGMTGAVKNVGIGATPPTIYGLGPGYPNPNERSQGINHGYAFSQRRPLHNWIHDYYMCRPVDFVVLDGLQGIQNGPLCEGSSHISEDQMNARLVMAGRDPIAVDAVASLLCGHDPQLIRHLVTLHNDSLGCVDPRLIRVEGPKVGDEKQDYEIHNSGVHSEYSDFTPPSFSVRACGVVGNDLRLFLEVDEEVEMVEAAVDGVLLPEVRLGDFADFTLDLDTLSVEVGSEVVVWAYDRYLNHASQVASVGTSVGNAPPVDLGLRIRPSPTRSSASIRYALRRRGRVELSVFSVDGRRVTTLLDQELAQGPHEVVWEPTTEAPGVYFVRLRTTDGTATAKVVKIE
jgi:uncharacterized protein (DUF362 family)